MPFPLKSGYSLRHKPRLLLDYPDHAARIGLVAAEWSAVEHHLAALLSFSLFAFSEKERGVKQIVENILLTIDSLPAKLDVIETLLEPRIPKNWFTRFIEEIRPELRRRARDRNKVVHGHWHTCDKYPRDLILVTPGEEPMRYTVPCLDDVAERMIATLNKVVQYCSGLQQTLYPKSFVVMKPISPREPPSEDTPPQSG